MKNLENTHRLLLPVILSEVKNLAGTHVEHAPIVVEIRGNPSKPILSYSPLYVNTLSYRIKGTDEGGNHPVPVNSIKPLLKLQVELMRPTFKPDRHPPSALLYR